MNIWIEIICYLLAGGLTGLLAGLLGIGGGLVVVPFLAFFLPLLGFPNAYVMHVAIATSLAIIVITSLSSAYSHQRKHAIEWPLVKKMVLGCVIGAVIGSQIADLLPSGILRIVFGLFVFLMAYRLLTGHQVHGDGRQLPGRAGLGISSIIISGFCTILGTGGGSLLVPFFSFYNVPMRNAVATSAACGFPIALAGAIGLLLAGKSETVLIPHAIGYIYYPAFIAMVIPGMLCAPVGAKLAHSVPTLLLKKIFAVFLIFVGIDMLYKAVMSLILKL